MVHDAVESRHLDTVLETRAVEEVGDQVVALAEPDQVEEQWPVEAGGGERVKLPALADVLVGAVRDAKELGVVGLEARARLVEQDEVVAARQALLQVGRREQAGRVRGLVRLGEVHLQQLFALTVHGLAQDSRGLSHHHVAILRQRQKFTLVCVGGGDTILEIFAK